MFGAFRQLSVSKLSAVLLLVIYYHGKLMGIVFFRLLRKRTRVNGRVVKQLRASPHEWFRWFCIIYRIGIFGYFSCPYFAWIVSLEDLEERVFHWTHLIINITSGVCIIGVQLMQSSQVIRMVNTLLCIIRRVGALTIQRNASFAGRRELSLLLLSLACRAFDFLFLIELFVKGSSLKNIIAWGCDTFLTVGTNMIMYISFVCYLTLGALYAQLNDYVRFQLRYQLQALNRPHGLQPGRQQLRTVRRNVDECLALYREIYSFVASFQRIFNILLLWGFIQNFSLIAVAIYVLTCKRKSRHFMLVVLIPKGILEQILLTLAVQGAVTQFRLIRRLSLENFYVSELKDWHMKFDMFLTHLNLYEFRVRPLGLFDVSNELVLLFFSALVGYLSFIIPCSMHSHTL